MSDGNILIQVMRPGGAAAITLTAAGELMLFYPSGSHVTGLEVADLLERAAGLLRRSVDPDPISLG